MKKVASRIGNIVMIFALVLSLVSNIKTEVRAAEDTENDTIVFDFSKENTWCYSGEPVTSKMLDNVDNFLQNLNPMERDVVFLSAMLYYNNLFDIEYNPGGEPNQQTGSASGRIVINPDKNQYINFKITQGGGKTIFNIDESCVGTYEVRLDYNSLKDKSLSDTDAKMPFFAVKLLYNLPSVDNTGNGYFKIKMIFNDEKKEDPKPTPVDDDEKDDPTPTPAPVEDEEKNDPTPDPAPAPVEDEENKDDPIPAPTPVEDEETKPSKENEKTEPAADEKKEEATTEKKNDAVKAPVLDTEFVEGGYSYKVTADGEVEFVTLTDKSAKTVVIPDTVAHQNVTYKVTSVADRALYNMKKLKSVTVGNNVTSIGNYAFAKSGKLKNVKIKSSTLTKVGNKAFSKNAKNLVVRAPKKQLKSYKKLLKKAKVSSLTLKKIK